MRLRPLAAILLTLALSPAACQLVWGYDGFEPQPGTGGSEPSSSSSSGGGGTTTSHETTARRGCTDHDSDGYLSWTCDPEDPALDCADEDENANPDAGFGAIPIMGARKPGTQDWDLDCDGNVTQEWHILGCGGFLLCGSGSGYAPGTDPACGGTYMLGVCRPTLPFFACTWSPVAPQLQRCK